MINLSFESVLIIVLVAFIIGLVVGVFLTRPHMS